MNRRAQAIMDRLQVSLIKARQSRTRFKGPMRWPQQKIQIVISVPPLNQANGGVK